MKTFPLHYCALLLLMLLVPVLVPAPDAFPSTYLAVLAIVGGIAAVTLMTWRNALPTDTVAQLIQRTERGERPSQR